MKKLTLTLAALATVGFIAPAMAEKVVIKHGHGDFHRHHGKTVIIKHGHHDFHGGKKVVIKKGGGDRY